MSEIKGHGTTARKREVELFLWRKRAASGALARPVLVLVHGSSLSALPCFDLGVPGGERYSMMDEFAERGFDVWTLDHEGYGRSSRTEGSSDVACGVEDLRAAIPVILRESGCHQVMLYGLSSGALRAACYAVAEPESVERLVLDGFVWTGAGSPTLAKRRAGLEAFKASRRRPIDHAFIASIFTRDRPGTTDPAVIEACAAAQLAYGDSVPSGTYVDMTSRLPLLDPVDLQMPTLVVRGEHDGIAAVEDLLEFYQRLPNPDKAFATLPGLAHCTPLGRNRHLLWHVLHAFLAMPARRDADAAGNARRSLAV